MTTYEIRPAGDLAGAAELPLAAAKLAPPRPRRGMVERPRIARALDAGRDAVLTLVAAPAGYGKTTAVRAWTSDRDAALAWVTLDTGDNDPGRLWTYAATAIDGIRPDLARRALQRLEAATGPMEAAIDALMDGIAAYSGEIDLVVDDLHTVTEPECLATLAYALRRVPPNLRILALTRTDPVLGLPRLRAAGDLADLRADELAFTLAEAREFLVERNGIALEASEVELLHDRTEGWPAALFLAAVWLRRVGDPHVAVRAFGADQRFLADYLSAEAIGALDADARAFLLRAAVLRRFTPQLADEVLGRPDSAFVLAELERTNLFVARLEHGGWYRVHSLFAEYAAFQLAAEDPAAVAEIHRRAAAWLRARGLLVEAIEHGVAAGDHAFVAGLLADHHLALVRSGRARTLLRWVETLPDDEVAARPELAVGAAAAATMIGRAVERRRLLQLADRARAERPHGVGPYAEALAATVRAGAVDGGVASAVEDGRRAVEIAEAEADAVLVAALAGHARALYLAGDLDAAWAAGLRAVDHPDAAGRMPGHAFARSTLALVAADRGRTTAARAHADRAKALVSGVGSSRSWLGANASAALAAALAAEGHLAEAERELVGAERFFADEVATVHHAWLLVVLSDVRCRRGRLDEAAATLRAAREVMDDLGHCGRVPALAAAVEAQIADAESRAGSGEMLEPPSVAELAVLRLLQTDLSTREIGAQLFLSPNTVRTHTRALYRKLAVNSRADAVARADVLGLLGETESPR
jgi:LuxR family transcriptional regulator, maltose regulon positive regulatory protein